MKNLIRTALSLMLCLVVCSFLSPTALAETIASGTSGDNLNWTLDNEGTLFISGYGDMTSSDGWSEHIESIKTIVIEQDATEAAQEAAEQTKDDAETAAESVSQGAAQIETNKQDIDDLKCALNFNKTATAGYLLRATNSGNGSEWAAVGLPTDEQTAQAVSDWLNDHPEATTTVQDGSLTYEKFANGTLVYVTPEMFGASGNGTDDDTSAVQDAVNHGGCIVVNGVYKITDIIYYEKPITIFGGGTFVVTSGKPLFFAKQNTNISGIIFKDFSIVGDGTTYTRLNNSEQAVIGNSSGNVLKNMVFQNLKISDVSFGIYLNADTSGEVKNVIVENCTFTNIFGSASGTGLGVAIANGRTNDGNICIRNNSFVNCGRHSIYSSHAQGVEICGNTIMRHGVNYTANAKNAAINIARSSKIIVKDNFISQSQNISILAITDANIGLIHCTDIEIKGNIICDKLSTAPDIQVGADNPDIAGYVKDVTISHNVIIAPASQTSTGAMVTVVSGINIRIDNNMFNIENAAHAYSRAIQLYAAGSTYPSDKYFIANNQMLSDPNVQNTRGIEVAQSVTEGTLTVIIYNNYINANQKVYLTTSVTNTNFRYSRTPMTAIPYIHDFRIGSTFNCNKNA